MSNVSPNTHDNSINWNLFLKIHNKSTNCSLLPPLRTAMEHLTKSRVRWMGTSFQLISAQRGWADRKLPCSMEIISLNQGPSKIPAMRNSACSWNQTGRKRKRILPYKIRRRKALSRTKCSSKTSCSKRNKQTSKAPKRRTKNVNQMKHPSFLCFSSNQSCRNNCRSNLTHLSYSNSSQQCRSYLQKLTSNCWFLP